VTAPREKRFGLKIRGQKEMTAAFKALPDVVRERMADAVEKTAVAIVSRMRANVRVDKGILKRDLDYSINRKTGKATTGIRKDSPRKSIGHLVEFGHGGPRPAPAYPFAIPAAEAEREGHLKRCKDAGAHIEKDMANKGDIL
jgi:hypothetical protein